MGTDRYQIVSQCGASLDGTSYRAWDREKGADVELRVLGETCTSPERWHATVKRLRLAALLNHPSALAVRALCFDDDPPRVVLEWAEATSLEQAMGQRVPVPAQEAIQIAAALADGCAEAHRLGLVHGHVSPAQIRLTADGRPKLDFTGLESVGASPRSKASIAGLSATAPTLPADPAEDVHGLARVLLWLLVGHAGDLDDALGNGATGVPLVGLFDLLHAGLERDPLERPSAREFGAQLLALSGSLVAPFGFPAEFSRHLAPVHDGRPSSNSVVELDELPLCDLAASATGMIAPPLPVQMRDPFDREALGRYRLLEKIGEGGMGAVYRALDTVDGTMVALKVLKPSLGSRPTALRRLRREARMLAELKSPGIANLLEFNEDGGVLFLVLEFVAGKSLAQRLDEHERLTEAESLVVFVDVARGLAEAHRRGIVHRDVKPDNVLLIFADDTSTDGPAVGAKLADFGLARHVIESESLNITQNGAVLGSPLYMAPEQCMGSDPVGLRADVYGLGATLFHALAGRPPFQAENSWQIMQMHQKEPPPPLRKLNAAASAGVCQIVEKCLAKNPEQRYADAGELLRDLERLQRGEPSTVRAHPLLPDVASGKRLRYEFAWELEAAPESLWPHVANTDRLNRAAGLPAVQFRTELGPDRRPRQFGEVRSAGLTVNWREHQFEWIEGRRHGVLREYSRGPFRWLVSFVDLQPRPGGGTKLTHTIYLEPNGWIGRLLAYVGVGVRFGWSLDRIYRRIDAVVTGQIGGTSPVDPFERPPAPTAGQRRRVERLVNELVKRQVAASIAEPLGDFLLHASPQDVARIRPIALARRLGVKPGLMVAACLQAARIGLLVILWDLLCPVCRIPSQIRQTLRDLRDHGRCMACDLDFALDFTSAVEMVFRVDPLLRASDLGTYCIGGPAHSPHVAAQVRVAPGERMEMTLGLGTGAYRLCGPQLSWSVDFRVDPTATRGRLDATLCGRGAVEPNITLCGGRQFVVLTNDFQQELLVRVERRTPRDDVLTAADATRLPLFRELFPHEVLSPGQAARVASVTLLLIDRPGAAELYQRLGDAQAFEKLHAHLGWLRACVVTGGGAVVRTVGEGLLASFVDDIAAVGLGLELQFDPRGKSLRLAVHRGPAMAATFDEHLDYFGTTVHGLDQLLGVSGEGEFVLSQAVAADPQVAALLQARAVQPALHAGDATGQALRLFPCLILSRER